MDCLRCENAEECWDCAIGTRQWFLDCERCIADEECWDCLIDTRQWFLPQNRKPKDFEQLRVTKERIIEFFTIDKPTWEEFINR